MIALILIGQLMMVVTYGAEEDVNPKVAEYVMSWQLSHGGWTKDKDEIYERYWNGTEKKAKYYQRDKVTPLGTIDNDATVSEIEYLSRVYNQYGKAEVKDSVLKGLEFLLTMQYESGGFPQVYPEQDHGSSVYENDATFNDNATVNVLYLYKDILTKEEPYSSRLISEDLYGRIEEAYYKGIDYVLMAQVEVDGELTAWGGQHNPLTYETTKGRAFEPLSIISKESVKIVGFLESIDTTIMEADEKLNRHIVVVEEVKDDAGIIVIEERHLTVDRIEASIMGAQTWLAGVAVEDTKYYLKGLNGRYFVTQSGKLTWYRFYEIGSNEPLFGDVDGSVTHVITEISTSRRHGYGWAGTWGKDIYRAMLADDVIFDDDIPAALPDLDADEEEFERIYEEEMYLQDIEEEDRTHKRNGIIAITALVLGLTGLITWSRRSLL